MLNFSFQPSISSFSTAFTSLFFFINAFIIWRSWQKNHNPLLKYFLIFLFSFAWQQLFFSLGTGTISLEPKINSWLWTFAHFFMFIGLSYFIRFPLAIQLPRLEKTVFTVSILYSLAGMGYFLLTAGTPAVDSKLLTNNVFIYLVPPTHTAIIVIFTTLLLLTSMIIFIYNAFKNKDRFIRWRSSLIALAILIFLTGGPLHNLVRTPGLTILADALIAVSMVIMVFAVYIKKFIKIKDSQPITTLETS